MPPLDGEQLVWLSRETDEQASIVHRLVPTDLAGMIWTNRLVILVLAVAISIELLAKIQNSSSGYLGTSDEWANYMRAQYLLLHWNFPAFDPLQIPHNPVVATVGPTVAMAALIMLIGTSPLVISYVGALIGGSVFVCLFLITRWMFATDANRGTLGLLAVGFAVLSTPLVARMQLFVGETLAFPLFLIAIGYYARGKYGPVMLLLLLVGFTEEFTLFMAILVIGLSGVISLICAHDSRRFKWSLLTAAVGSIPEAILFIAQGPQNRIGQASQGFFPYPHVFLNFETIVGFLGVTIPFLGLVGFLIYFRDSLHGGINPTSITLIVWLVVSTVYSLLPPFLPGGSQFRTLDYVSLPGSILGAYGLAKLVGHRNQEVILLCSYFVLASTALYVFLAHVYSPFSFIASYGSPFVSLGTDLFVIATAGIFCVSVFLVFWKLGSLRRLGYKKIATMSLLFLFATSIVQASFYTPYETKDWTSYFTLSETTFLADASHTLPLDSVIATNYILASNVAGLTNRTVKDLPAYQTSPEIILSDIRNSSIFSEQFGTVGGVVPPSLQVPIGPHQPVYLLVIVGSYAVVSTTPAVLTQLEHESQFRLIGASGNLFLFSVTLAQ